VTVALCQAGADSLSTNNASDELVREQIASLSLLSGVGTRVSLPQPNNFAVMLVPRAATATAHLDAFVDLTAPLNIADAELLARCEALTGSGDVPDELVAPLSHILYEWRRNLEARSNLIGCLFAIRFASLLGTVRPLSSLVAEEWADVGRAFLDVDPIVHELVRINVYLPPGMLEHAVHVLLEHDDECGLLDSVDRIEVAKRLTDDADWVVPGYPTLMLYTGCHSASASNLDVLLAALRTLIERVHLPAPPSESLNEYALAWHRNANFTQGFRLYKRYLSMLGLLDGVYDATTSYALVQPTMAQLPVSVAVRALARR
jgi:hypothetical protein